MLVNELARPALLLNLPVQADETPVCAPGEPAYLSLRRLLRTSPRWAVADQTVFVCENPNLVAIVADRLGGRCGPLVCTDGMPAAAQRTLLTQLAHAGAHLRYHGDFDWAGLQIANHVLRAWGAHPWRLGTLDYEAAASASHTRRDLAASRIVASWDAALAPAMQLHGRAIAEEAVAATLLGDLRQG
ncbi:MAG: TIGR02679 family protein [Burkholderiaceae bacterium]|nr:TIGR02679 family protein [Burkholderiaceae bacterium]